ncbi:endolytic transglycosylase MltG [Halobacillus salinus]|uniref:endolytic transglycosylase MltG n=1 Tax=Halobacillus salinus TaxID=192814 RepID=UPI0009A7F277|nr:endolytic transglycosylase MltG [Halobacillus salinus]
MKHLLRSFSLGLFVATVLLGGTLYLQPQEAETSLAKKGGDTKDMIAHVESSGYHVLSNEEFESLNQKKKDKEAAPDESNIEKVFVYSLDIVSGTTTEDISKKLEEAGVIDQASELEQYMSLNDYSRFIQVGQATVNSDMSLNEIAKAITSK